MKKIIKMTSIVVLLCAFIHDCTKDAFDLNKEEKCKRLSKNVLILSLMYANDFCNHPGTAFSSRDTCLSYYNLYILSNYSRMGKCPKGLLERVTDQ